MGVGRRSDVKLAVLKEKGYYWMHFGPMHTLRHERPTRKWLWIMEKDGAGRPYIGEVGLFWENHDKVKSECMMPGTAEQNMLAAEVILMQELARGDSVDY